MKALFLIPFLLAVALVAIPVSADPTISISQKNGPNQIIDLSFENNGSLKICKDSACESYTEFAIADDNSVTVTNVNDGEETSEETVDNDSSDNNNNDSDKG